MTQLKLLTVGLLAAAAFVSPAMAGMKTTHGHRYTDLRSLGPLYMNDGHDVVAPPPVVVPPPLGFYFLDRPARMYPAWPTIYGGGPVSIFGYFDEQGPYAYFFSGNN